MRCTVRWAVKPGGMQVAFCFTWSSRFVYCLRFYIAFGYLLPGVQVHHRWVLFDLLVHQGLGQGGVVGFVVTVAAVTP